MGTPILASADGTVTVVKDLPNGYGKYIMLQHEGGYQTIYAHLSTFAVRIGQEVSKGDIIGYSGSSGNSTGPHLHFEMRNQGVRIDPKPIMQSVVDTKPINPTPTVQNPEFEAVRPGKCIVVCDALNLDVKGTGETTVNLNVSVLGLGYLKDGEVQDGYLVDNGTVKNLKGETGFTNLSYSKKTIVAASGSFLRGDVNQDGKVSVEDATTLQRYLAEYITLSPEQMLAADANNDGKVNIRDVSAIQRAVAKYITLPA